MERTDTFCVCRTFDTWDVTDEELTAEAMAADPDVVVADDAEPFGVSPNAGLLAGLVHAGRRAGPTNPRHESSWSPGMVVSLLIVNAAGLCVTYGWPEIAW